MFHKLIARINLPLMLTLGGMIMLGITTTIMGFVFWDEPEYDDPPLPAGWTTWQAPEPAVMPGLPGNGVSPVTPATQASGDTGPAPGSSSVSSQDAGPESASSRDTGPTSASSQDAGPTE